MVTMKILVQNYSSGNLEMLEVPMIRSKKGLLIDLPLLCMTQKTDEGIIPLLRNSGNVMHNLL